MCNTTTVQNILLVKNENERLGMHIKGGLNGQRGNPIDPADEGVFVSKINSSGAARRDGRLKVCVLRSHSVKFDRFQWIFRHKMYAVQ